MCVHICIYKYMLFISHGSAANQWGSKKGTKITCSEKLPGYRIQLLILASGSCSDITGCTLRLYNWALTLQWGSLQNSVLLSSFPCLSNLEEGVQVHKGGSSPMVHIPRSQEGNWHSLIVWPWHVTTSHHFLISTMLIIPSSEGLVMSKGDKSL